MGTRADFYIGRGKDAEWLGSIAWDGYPEGAPKSLLKISDGGTFRSKVAEFLAEESGATSPEQGWPWPWSDSNTTDYAYAFDGDRVYGACFGTGWWPADEPQPEEDPNGFCEFPDMSARKNLATGNRSGMIIITRP